MDVFKCPYCESFQYEKYIPEKGNKMFIGSVNTKTGEVHTGTGFICDLYVCTKCGNIRLQLNPQ